MKILANNKTMKKYFFFIALSLNAAIAFAQNHCGNTYLEERLQEKNPNYFAELEDYYQEIAHLNPEEETSFRNVIQIPVVVHIVHRGTAVGTAHNLSESIIQSQLDVLNKDFRRNNTDANQTPSAFSNNAMDTEIEFCLAAFDPNGNPSSGITRHVYNNIPNVNYIEDVIKGQTNWDPNRYLNLWSVPMPTAENYILGYSYLPTNMILGTDLDGVVIAHDKFGVAGTSKGRTATHEIGHYLGLQHIFGPGNGACNQDDSISDTPSSNAPYYGCPSHPRSSCGSQDMFMNYMDYVDDTCMNMFTFGQSVAMRSVLNSSRSQLIANASTACNLDTAMEEFVLAQPLETYPNPSHNYCVIQLASKDIEALERVDLFDSNGQNISVKMDKNRTNLKFETASLSNGVYFAVLGFEKNKVIYQKIVVQH